MLVLHQDAGDHKGPPHVHSTTLAPTDQMASRVGFSGERASEAQRQARHPQGAPRHSPPPLPLQ